MSFPTDKDDITETVKCFVECLVNNGLKVASIARAIGITKSNTIKTHKFGNKTALKIIEAYSNNYKIYIESDKKDCK